MLDWAIIVLGIHLVSCCSGCSVLRNIYDSDDSIDNRNSGNCTDTYPTAGGRHHAVRRTVKSTVNWRKAEII